MSKGKQLGQNGGRYTGASGACLQQLAKQSFSKTLTFGRTEALSLAESKEQHPDHSFLGLSPDQGGPIRSSCDGSGRGVFLYAFDPWSDSICVRGQRAGEWQLRSTSSGHSQPCVR